MDNLVKDNEKMIFAKLDNLNKYQNMYICCEVLKLLSQSINSDKVMISSWDANHVIVKEFKLGTIRKRRVFRKKGFRRYLSEGNIRWKPTVFKYFGLNEKDPDQEYLEKHLIDGKFNTKLILKWIFQKRKQCKALGNNVALMTLIEWLDYHNKPVPLAKKNALRKFAGIEEEKDECSDDVEVDE